MLKAQKDGDLIFLDFPKDKPEVLEQGFSEILFGFAPDTVLRGTDDYLFIFDKEEKIKSINANYEEISKLDSRGAIASSKDSEGNIVSRCFYPKYGVNEDPVTGSAHTLIIPYWSDVLGRNKIKARQLSERGGELFCEVSNDRIKIGGHTSLFFDGQIKI